MAFRSAEVRYPWRFAQAPRRAFPPGNSPRIDLLAQLTAFGQRRTIECADYRGWRAYFARIPIPPQCGSAARPRGAWVLLAPRACLWGGARSPRVGRMGAPLGCRQASVGRRPGLLASRTRARRLPRGQVLLRRPGKGESGNRPAGFQGICRPDIRCGRSSVRGQPLRGAPLCRRLTTPAGASALAPSSPADLMDSLSGDCARAAR